MDDAHTVLGVSSSATRAEIDAAYRDLAARFHPANYPDAGDEERARWAAAMARIDAAYASLNQPSVTAMRPAAGIANGSEGATRPAPAASAAFTPPAAPPQSNAWSAPAPESKDLILALCQLCGPAPAIACTAQHQYAYLFQARTHRRSATMCKRCGRNLLRSAQNRTMIFGWWGVISFFRNCGFVVQNAQHLYALSKLSDPAATTAAAGPGLAAGRPVWLRSGALLAAGLLVAGVAGGLNASKQQSFDWGTGACVAVVSSNQTHTVPCSQTHAGRIVGHAASTSACPRSAESYVNDDSGGVWCIDRDQ